MWELVKEGVLDAPLDGNHGEKHPTSNEYVDEGIPFLMASDVHDGDVDIKSCKFITKERAEQLDKGFARNGDVLLTHKASIGETAILNGLTTEYAMLTPQVTYYRIQNEERLNRKYLYAFFNSLDFQNDLKTKAAQSTRPYIGITAQQNLNIVLPKDVREQERIGTYFYNLDNLITLHQRKSFFKTFKIIVWEQRKFSDVFTGLQNNTLSRSKLNYESGTVKNVHYGDVLIKFGDYIDASKEELPFINDDSKVEKFKGSFLHNGDIIIADTAEDETVGKCTEIQGVDDIKLISGLHTIPCRPKEEYGAKFLGYYMNSSAYRAQLIPLMQGIKVTSISKSALQDTDMIIPKSVDEQTIIGEYFSNLDNLITLHRRAYHHHKRRTYK